MTIKDENVKDEETFNFELKVSEEDWFMIDKVEVSAWEKSTTGFSYYWRKFSKSRSELDSFFQGLTCIHPIYEQRKVRTSTLRYPVELLLISDNKSIFDSTISNDITTLLTWHGLSCSQQIHNSDSCVYQMGKPSYGFRFFIDAGSVTMSSLKKPRDTPERKLIKVNAVTDADSSFWNVHRLLAEFNSEESPGQTHSEFRQKGPYLFKGYGPWTLLDSDDYRTLTYKLMLSNSEYLKLLSKLEEMSNEWTGPKDEHHHFMLTLIPTTIIVQLDRWRKS